MAKFLANRIIRTFTAVGLLLIGAASAEAFGGFDQGYEGPLGELRAPLLFKYRIRPHKCKVLNREIVSRVVQIKALEAKQKHEVETLKRSELGDQCVVKIKGLDSFLKTRSIDPGFWSLKYVLHRYNRFFDELRDPTHSEKLEPWDLLQDVESSPELRRLKRSEECSKTVDYFYSLQLQHIRMLETASCHYEE